MASEEEIDLWNEIIEVTHAFEAELNTLVMSSLRFSLEGIARAEEEEIERMSEALEDLDVQNSHAWHVELYYSKMRTAAHNFALVGLVTRLQHWVERFVRLNKVKPEGEKNDHRLCKCLHGLNKAVNATPPIAVEFIDGLVTARDSVIHGDSKSTWFDEPHQKQRSVAQRFDDFGDLNVSQSDLEDAVQKSTQLVSWYESSLEKAGMKTR